MTSKNYLMNGRQPSPDDLPTSAAGPSEQDIQNLMNMCNSGAAAAAEQQARRMLEEYGDVSGILRVLGSALTAQGKLKDAVASYRRVLELAPGDVQTRVNLGNALARLGSLEEAVACYQQVLRSEPGRAFVHSNLGNALALLGRLEEATASYQQALKINPGNAQALSNLGNALTHLGRYEEAVASLRQAISINPDNAQSHGNLGNVLVAQGKIEEAVATYRQAVKINPAIAQMHNNLGNALMRLGGLDEALTSFQQALKLKPDAETFYNLHTLLLDQDNMAPAIQCLGAAVKLQPGNIGYKLFLGMALEYSGQAEAAADHFKAVSQGSSWDKARLDAWNYIKSANEKMPKMLGSLIDGFKIGMDAAPASGLVLEFGVRFGVSIRQIAHLAGQRVHGFDSFEGLPEQWHDEPKGSYTTQGVLPDVSDNVQLHRGWFEDTLPEFIKTYREPVRFMNIDCDIYSATKTILDCLASQIVPGTVIVFDEYIGNEHWREDEYKAFQEAVDAYGWRYEYLGFSMFTKQVVVRIL